MLWGGFASRSPLQAPGVGVIDVVDVIDDSTPEGEFECVTTVWAGVFILERFLQ